MKYEYMSNIEKDMKLKKPWKFFNVRMDCANREKFLTINQKAPN